MILGLQDYESEELRGKCYMGKMVTFPIETYKESVELFFKLKPTCEDEMMSKKNTFDKVN